MGEDGEIWDSKQPSYLVNIMLFNNPIDHDLLPNTILFLKYDPPFQNDSSLKKKGCVFYSIFE